MDQKLINDLCKYNEIVSISMPNLQQINYPVDTLDQILEDQLSSVKEGCRCFGYCSDYSCDFVNHKEDTYNKEIFNSQSDRWPNKLHFDMPDVSQIDFFG